MIKEKTVLSNVRLFRTDCVGGIQFVFQFFFDFIHSIPGWVWGFINSVVSEVLLTRLSPGFVKPVFSGIAGCPDDSVVLPGWVRRPAINLGGSDDYIYSFHWCPM